MLVVLSHEPLPELAAWPGFLYAQSFFSIHLRVTLLLACLLTILTPACSHQPPSSLPAPALSQPSKKRALAASALTPATAGAAAIAAEDAGAPLVEGAAEGGAKKKRKRRGKKKKATEAGKGGAAEAGAEAEAEDGGVGMSMEL